MESSVHLLKRSVRILKKKMVPRDSKEKKCKGKSSYTIIITLLSSGPVPRDSTDNNWVSYKLVPHDLAHHINLSPSFQGR
jgi:hypothetical protein